VRDCVEDFGDVDYYYHPSGVRPHAGEDFPKEVNVSLTAIEVGETGLLISESDKLPQPSIEYAKIYNILHEGYRCYR